MSDAPRDPDDSDVPTSRIPPSRPDPIGSAPIGSAPIGSAPIGSAPIGSIPAGSASAGDGDDGTGTGERKPAGEARPAGKGGRFGGLAGRLRPAGRRRPMFEVGPTPDGPEDDARLRRRRRWFLAGIAIAAAVVVIALCAGLLSFISGGDDDDRDRPGSAQESRQRRDLACLELERRLNRLVPPGATTGPAARATAIRDENSAARLYVTEAQSAGAAAEDRWRQLIDARTVYADALDRQAKSRTPAFYVAPRAADGTPVADQLANVSPAACAGPVRRLAAPDL